MSSFLRRISNSSQKSDKDNHVNLFPLEDPEQERYEEMHSTFTARDADIYAPTLVKDMTWERFKERVLDCGCGSGKTGFTHLLPQVYLHDSHLYSMDASEALVSYASMKWPHPSMTYAQGDFMDKNFPFKYITFDKIFALHVLQCIKDYRTAVSRFFELLRPGGELGMICATDLFCGDLDREFAKDEKWQKYFQNVDEKPSGESSDWEQHDSFQLQIHAHMDHVGFEVAKIKTEPLEYTFSTLEKAVVYYIATSPFVKSIPAELQDPLEEDCLEKMMKDYNIMEISDPYNISYNLLYIVARKPGQPQKVKVHKHKKNRDRLFSLPDLKL